MKRGIDSARRVAPPLFPQQIRQRNLTRGLQEEATQGTTCQFPDQREKHNSNLVMQRGSRVVQT